jgi:two-component system sensor histidine kinase KdpD
MRRLGLFLTVAVPSLAGATLLVWLLQDALGVPNPSAVYLVAVVATAIVSGTAGAIATAVAAFVLYNFFFTEPRYTLSMHEPGVWLSVVLLLFVGVVVGQLTALQRSRAELARRREREARALFGVSHGLAMRESIDAVLPLIAHELQADTHMERVWISLGAGERPGAGEPTDAGAGSPQGGALTQLRRNSDGALEWVRVHPPTGRARGASEHETFRVPIESAGQSLGSIWALRKREIGLPESDETRLLAAASDQLGQAVAHDRMAADSRAAEVAYESDALKSALLQSVSHDLRTPLATIRAAAGTLRAENLPTETARRESVDAIEREVEYLNRLVTNLLDLSRIEAGAIRANVEPFEIDDVVGATIERLAPRFDGRPLDYVPGREVVAADPVFLDAALTNVIENALRHTSSGTRIRVSTGVVDGVARLTVDDGGTGVPEELLPRLFEKFYRVPGSRASRHGTGIGLAVVHGLVEAMGGHVAARRSELGGLAIDIDLPLAQVPAELAQPAPA